MESTKNRDIRINNRKRIVNMLFRQGQMTKQELAKRLDISLPTVNLLLKELTDKGLVTKGNVLDSTGGRKPICHMPVYDARYSIGVEATSTGLRVVLMDLGSNIVKKAFYPLKRSYTEAYWKSVNDIIMKFAKQYVSDMRKLLDVGVTLNLPMQDGQIVSHKGALPQDRVSPQMPMDCFELPVKFRNSTKMAAVAQIWTGEEKENFAFVSLGESVRGAMVHGGNVIDFSGINGEFGQLYLNIGEGNVRAKEFFGAKALCERAGVSDVQSFFDNIHNQNSKCTMIWYEYLDCLCKFLHNIYCIFGWKIVIGGSLSSWLEAYKSYIEATVEALYDITDLAASFVSISHLGEYGAAVGAAMLPIDDFLEFGYEN